MYICEANLTALAKSDRVALWSELVDDYLAERRELYVGGELALDGYGDRKARKAVRDLVELVKNGVSVMSPPDSASRKRLSDAIKLAGPLVVSLFIGAAAGRQDLLICDAGSIVSIEGSNVLEIERAVETFCRYRIAKSDYGVLDLVDEVRVGDGTYFDET